MDDRVATPVQWVNEDLPNEATFKPRVEECEGVR